MMVFRPGGIITAKRKMYSFKKEDRTVAEGEAR